jgi:hypothetical protein
MQPPPDNEKRRPWQDGAFEKSKQQKQRYRISLETQAGFWILAPTFLIVALLAIGARI